MKLKRLILLVLSISFGVAGVCLLVAAGLWALADRFVESIDESPQRLVYHTDHAAVLRACRQVLADPQAAGFGRPANGTTEVSGSQGGAKVPAALPTVLRDLNFEFMTVEGGRATIYFGGGFGHWGYSTARLQAGSELELIPGLWFWSEGRLPRDLSKFPYYRTSKRLLLAGMLLVAAAIAVIIYRRRIKTTS